MSSDGTADAWNVPPASRDGKGRWRKGIESYERDAEACRMYVAGKTYQMIADELGYGNRGHAHTAVQKILMETIREPADEVRALMRARQEEIYVMARAVAMRKHFAHSAGKLIYMNGEPLVDDGPKLAAMDRMGRAMAEVSKLTGAYSPQKFENLSLEAVQAEIARLEVEAAEAGYAPE